MDLADAIRQFRDREDRASNRQEAIQLYCCEELAKRGLPDARIEAPMPAYYRRKKWDVGLIVDDEPRLGISCKSIIKNFGGTVPNRVDDMLGEAVSLHRAYPNAVIGYLFMMGRVDESRATERRTEDLGGMTPKRLAYLRDRGDLLFERLVESVSAASGRSGPDDFFEKWEAVSCAQIDFTVEPFAERHHPHALKPAVFLDRLVEIYRERFGP